MPRIRKQTSKRKGTNDRAKLKHKITEGRKKNRKNAKKNPQWKSRVKKDPGIPNAFPFKDQIIGEIEEARKNSAAEKERRQELQKTLKASEVATISGVSVIASGTTKLHTPKSKKEMEDSEMTDEEDEAPPLLDTTMPSLREALKKANVVIEVLDARDPLAFRNLELEKHIVGQDKKLLFLLNKVDLVPRENAETWLKTLRAEYPTFAFHSASHFIPSEETPTSAKKGKAKAKDYDECGAEGLSECLSLWSEGSKTPLTVALVGLPNSGKSSIINSLTHQSTLPVYKGLTTSSGLTTTPYPRSVCDTFLAGTHKITFIDTPGIVASTNEVSTAEERLSFAARDMVLRNRGKMDKISDPLPGTTYILSRANTEDLMVHYNIPAFIPGDITAFLRSVARSTGRIHKAGEPDIKDQARSILRDIRVGKFPFYAVPAKVAEARSSKSSTASPALTELYSRTDPLLMERLKTRKELVLAGGLVRIKAGSADTRTVDLDVQYQDRIANDAAREKAKNIVDDSSEDEDEDEDEEGDGEDDKDDEDGASDEDSLDADMMEDLQEVEDSDSATPPPNLLKRKRPVATVSHHPSKKVAFVTKPAPKTQPKPLADQVLKSSLKKTSITSKKSHEVPALRIKVANAGHGTKLRGGKAPLSSDKEQPYDFKKHFR